MNVKIVMSGGAWFTDNGPTLLWSGEIADLGPIGEGSFVAIRDTKKVVKVLTTALEITGTEETIVLYCTSTAHDKTLNG